MSNWSPSWKSLFFALVFLGGVCYLLGLFQLNRCGFSPDEELTFFTVKAVSEHGLPILRSGYLSDRALPYTYISWLLGFVFGHNLVTYRVVSFLFSMITVGLLMGISRKMGNWLSATMVGLLIAFWPVLMTVSIWARCYSMFLAFYLGSLLLFVKSLKNVKLVPFYLASLVITRALYEPGLSLLALPIIRYVASDDPEERYACRKLFVLSAISLVILELVLTQYVRLLPVPQQPFLQEVRQNPGTDTVWHSVHLRVAVIYWNSILDAAKTRPFHSAALIGFCVAAFLVMRRTKAAPFIRAYLIVNTILLFTGQFGLILPLLMVFFLLRPEKTGVIVLIGISATCVAILIGTVRLLWGGSVAFSFGLPKWAFVESMASTLSGVTYFSNQWPITSVILVLLAAALALWPDVFRNTTPERELLSFMVLNLIPIGFFQVPIVQRFYLIVIPLAYLLISLIPVILLKSTFWLGGQRGATVSKGFVSLFSVMILFAILIDEHGRALSSSISENENVIQGLHKRTLQTFDSCKYQQTLSQVDRNGPIISNNELGAMYLFGRVDFWLPRTEYYLRRYSIEGGKYGIYCRSQVVTHASQLKAILSSCCERSATIVLMNTANFLSYHNDESIGTMARMFEGSAIIEPVTTDVAVIKIKGDK